MSWWGGWRCSMSEYILTQSIIEKSESNTWGPAKNEWELDSIFDSDEQETCACGHFPIKEVCVLRNIQNQSNYSSGQYSSGSVGYFFGDLGGDDGLSSYSSTFSKCYSMTTCVFLGLSCSPSSNYFERSTIFKISGLLFLFLLDFLIETGAILFSYSPFFSERVFGSSASWRCPFSKTSEA